MSKYNVNFKRLALILLPTFWRRPIFGALTYAAMSPLNYIHARFIQFQRDTDYRLTHNGQVCYLRAVLNDMFDPIDRRITITDNADDTGTFFLYKREADKPRFLFSKDIGITTITTRRGFDGINGYDFWVNVPLSLHNTLDIDRLRAVINTYKLASKRFSINFVQ